jgi:hypothetical protein
MTSEGFTATVAAAARGGVLIPVPFDPDTVWGTKPRTISPAPSTTEKRPQRIAEMIQQLEAGHKQRPQQ